VLKRTGASRNTKRGTLFSRLITGGGYPLFGRRYLRLVELLLWAIKVGAGVAAGTDAPSIIPLGLGTRTSDGLCGSVWHGAEFGSSR